MPENEAIAQELVFSTTLTIMGTHERPLEAVGAFKGTCWANTLTPYGTMSHHIFGEHYLVEVITSQTNAFHLERAIKSVPACEEFLANGKASLSVSANNTREQ